MSTQRFKALETVNERVPREVSYPAPRVSDYFGSHTFGEKNMRVMLTAETYQAVQQAVQRGEKISEGDADAVASAMKNWAMGLGATHYTHWFQPLTGATAEKHDAFFTVSGDGTPLERFKGEQLVRQEPDASSFPSGGLRATFEARGYTAWDPSSPAFIMESGHGRTLCIPTVFVSYTGETLDNKAPLLKSLETIDEAATAVCQYFDRNVTRVSATLGNEQEFFLIDKALANARPDLVLAGRTVFGRPPSKGQQLDDHYFGSIPERVKRFLQELEIESYKLGIPLTTRHNEVAPAQFEIAPLFEEANRANDHNQIMMDVMETVADRHDFKVLFHEKPFAGLNGSGKHNNWSMSTDTGVNLLQPSSRARENLRFLTFFVNTIKAVDDHAALLRASIASAGNDYRLGANEAPPAIISVFIGSQLGKVLDELEQNANVKVERGDNVYMKLGIDKIPPILLDNTDRNRTSPFAFTGNKFELRAVGSAANNAVPMTVLNMIVANQLVDFKKDVDAQIAEGTKKEVAIINVLREYVKASKKVIFEGDGYSDDWVAEAERRGLPNIKDTPRALDLFVSDEAKEIFGKFNVMSESELHARHEVQLENYTLNVGIEADLMANLALNHIVPTAIEYQNKLIENANGLKSLGLEAEANEVIASIRAISGHVAQVKRLSRDMMAERARVDGIEDAREQAIAICDAVKHKFFEELRGHVDELELLVDDAFWPLPKYRELLFLR